MSNRSSILVLVGALLGCVVIALCVGLLGGVFYLTNGGANPLALLGNTPLALPGTTISASVNRIAYVGNDLNIYIADPADGTTRALTTDAGPRHGYNHPTWSPNSSRLAYVGYTLANGIPTEGALYTTAPDSDNPIPIYTTTRNIPFYLYWSPDSRMVSFLANQDAETIALHVARSDEEDSMQVVDTGAPFYWAWAPDSSQMFTHVGGTRAQSEDARLALLTFNNAESKRSLDAAPGQFQAPQWSRDGKILYSASNGSQQTIESSDVLGNDIKTLATYSGRASFASSPDGADVAYILTEAQTRLPHFGPLRVVDANGENVRSISEQPVLAFLWSPDSAKLAYLTVTLGQDESSENLDARISETASIRPEKFPGEASPNQGQENELELHWRLWDRAANESRTIASFSPTVSFLNVIPYFDQYANSSTFWSPDSQSFVYTARETNTTGAVFIADAIGNNPPRRVGDGLIAFWSWK
jgi:TolB protein